MRAQPQPAHQTISTQNASPLCAQRIECARTECTPPDQNTPRISTNSRKTHILDLATNPTNRSLAAVLTNQNTISHKMSALNDDCAICHVTNNEDYIFCDNERQWYHTKCLGLSEEEFEKAKEHPTYACPECTKENKGWKPIHMQRKKTVTCPKCNQIFKGIKNKGFLNLHKCKN